MAKDIWQQLLDELETNPLLFRLLFELHLRDTRLISYQDGTLTVSVPDESSRAWIEDRARAIIERTLVGIVGYPVQVQFQSPPPHRGRIKEGVNAHSNRMGG